MTSSSPPARRRRRWLLAAAGVAALALIAGVATLVALSRLTGGLDFDRAGVDRSIGAALERGEREDDRLVIDLSGAELAELITEGMEAAGVQVDELTVDVAAAGRPDRGRLRVSGRFDDGDGAFRGRAGVEVVAGALQVDMEDFELRGYRLPRWAHSAAGDLVAEAASIESILAERDLRLSDVSFADDRVRIVAHERHTGPLARPSAGSDDGDDTGDADDGSAPSAGRADVPPGEVRRSDAAGDPAMVVVGDSVAAGVGVDDYADNYVSRVHGWLQRRDDAVYGLANLAIPGETSWSLREQGQLDRALATLERAEAALVVVDIGANDVLSALGHPACADDVTTARCDALLEGRLDDYRASFDATLADLRAVAPKAPLVVMTTYNPFSFGGDTALEQRSDAVVAELNHIAGYVGRRYGARVADGATPLRGRAGELTHMGGAEAPDVHPNAAGYRELAGAVVDVLQRPAPRARPTGYALEPEPR